MKSMLTSTNWYIALNRAFSSANSQHHIDMQTRELNQYETCPPCDSLFLKLENTGQRGKMSQVVRVQERGEPKSGTGMMFDWATASLLRTCEYLQDNFGQESCWVDFTDEHGVDTPSGKSTNRTMTFDPALGRKGASCPCETVERVSIVVGNIHKHILPVGNSCPYQHPRGIDLGVNDEGKHPNGNACTFADGAPVENFSDLWRCVNLNQANCAVVDDWLQLAVFRDPRPVAVSAFFHKELHKGQDLGSLDEFMVKHLPLMCQWVAIRYILFSGLLSRQSVTFWYADTLTDPWDWHTRWFDALGLQLPMNVVSSTAQEAFDNDFNFEYKKIDKHPGGVTPKAEGVRRFEDEVSQETLELADSILRKWLPPDLLFKLGVT